MRRHLMGALGAAAALIAVPLRGAARDSAGESAAAAEGQAGAAQVSDLRDELVTANRILFHQGVFDAFGHISARDPANPAHYLMARSVQPPLVTRADIVALDADSNSVEKGASDVPLERFIHGEIYRRRADVRAIVHSHAAVVLPFTVVKDTPLRAICHTCGFIGSGAPLFEIRESAGEGSNMLVQNRELGSALAATLGTKTLVLMRGHGFTVVGGSIQEAVYNAVNTLLNARVERDALSLGKVTYLTDAEAAATSRIHNTTLNRSWEIWAKQAAGELR